MRGTLGRMKRSRHMRICQIKELILKPCPFCGGNAIICASKGESIKDNKYISNIVCSCCDAAVQGVIASSMLEADIKAARLWNKRTAVNVVHCKDCKWFIAVNEACGKCTYRTREFLYNENDDYCSYGELKEE